MYSPSLQYALVQAQIRDLHRSRETWSAQPITAKDSTASRRWPAQLSIYLSHAIERFAGHAAPEAYAR